MTELGRWLATVPMFGALDDDAREGLARRLEAVDAAAGETVLVAGEPTTSLYLLASGRLRVSRLIGGEERVLHEIAPPAVFGEVAVLTQQPRTATIRAVRDCELYRLSREAFESLIEHHPIVLRRLAHLLANRVVQVTSEMAEAGARAIAVAPAGRPGGPASEIAAGLLAEFGDRREVCRIGAADVDRALGSRASQRRPGQAGWGELARWLSAVENDHRTVVLEPGSQPDQWARTCLRRADLVLTVADCRQSPELHAVERLAEATEVTIARRELLLVRPSGQHQPQGTSRWLRTRSVSDHHHLRSGVRGDLARLARMVKGEGCGLVLGGGGPRGFAHLGVARALEEAGFPFDVVGGTSIGAVMGALCAMDIAHEERVTRAVTAFTGQGRLVDLTLPLVSLARGRKVTRLLKEGFDDQRIEDLPRRFYCVSADLVSADQVVHERGALWHAVRATLALPGIFPPVRDGARVLVDGAVLNDLPADVMRERLPSGVITAVDLSVAKESPVWAEGPAVGPAWRNGLPRRRGSPSIVDILSRAQSLASVHARQLTSTPQLADLYLHPRLPPVGALDFSSAASFVDIGYRQAAAVLATHEFDRGWLPGVVSPNGRPDETGAVGATSSSGPRGSRSRGEG